MIDETDTVILSLLQRDSRLTNSQIAAEAGISPSSCWRRVKSLETIGLIKGYGAILDRGKAGFSFSAILHVSLSRQVENTVQAFVHAVEQRPEILDCFATTGDADYHLRVVVGDIGEYNDFLDNFLFRLPGIAHVRSNIILKDIKSTQLLPLKGIAASPPETH
ncbi:Lrp/AsnC family transcriptional regulator [Sneathiella chinensis]|uniref:Transcriptional regulator n=1 Tax=Sneathiella chinensis TaxID=349750 RepID=A0ABQ5U409_9PROT|nr:Lrp/AsnC family transcriptional regulator [Sneathiella chinensis]GLQ05973.1 transcriptional regulator [Sneathiella chinensis]